MNLPQGFKKFPKTRIIIDCSEYCVQKPQSPEAQSQSWSDYKHSNTFKQLIAISPNGAFTFLSQLYSGRISDRDITDRSGFFDKLTSGDGVMAHRGFTVKDLLIIKRCTMNAPPFTNGKPLSKSQTTQTRRITRARIHVERAIGRLKNFKILNGVIPLTFKSSIDQITIVCAAICNLNNNIVTS